ncbi:MAG TPA: Crp/Fnr family transcriptional regulator [Albitalea sp.]
MLPRAVARSPSGLASNDAPILFERCAVATNAYAMRIAESLRIVERHAGVVPRTVHAGDTVFRAGERFTSLHVIRSGFFKVVNFGTDGREQVVSLQFKGDWLGFDGIAAGRHSCDAVALEAGEIWSVRYDSLVRASAEYPPLLSVLNAAMSREIARDRDWLRSRCTLSVDARVAEFLHRRMTEQMRRGLLTDQVTLRMTRAEIGNYLCMTLESVSRALCRLARDGLIDFPGNGRQEVHVPDVDGLARFVRRDAASPGRGHPHERARRPRAADTSTPGIEAAVLA